MGPKNKFSREQIIEAAFDIARAEGIDSISIRKVAEKLGSSIAPIYVNFNDIDELKQAVMAKVFAIGRQMASEQNTGSPFHDIGVASLRFAREYSVIFKELMLKNNHQMQGYDKELGNVLIQQMKDDPELTDFTEKELHAILLKMRIFQLGLSIMAANDLLPAEFDEAAMLNILESSAMDVILGTRMRQGNE